MKTVDANEKRKASLMPTSFEAVCLMHDAYDRLRQLGWSSGVYCPKDGSEFAVIEHGSTGIFTGRYSGEWPEGYIICEDCVEHPEGIMWKPIDKLTDWEETARKLSAEDTRQFIERIGQMAESN